jgi:beta-lactamase regulating signal transducer with metallopeptidase domain
MTSALAQAVVTAGRSPEASLLAKATLVLATGLLLAWLARRAPAAVRHLALSATFAAALLLPVATAVGPSLAVVVAVAPGAPDAEPAEAGPGPAAVAEPPAARVASAGDGRSWPSAAGAARAAWAAGAALLLAWLAFAHWRLDGIRRHALPWLARRDLARALAAPAGVRRPVELVISEDVAAPLTCGWRRPAIVVPADAVDWEEEDLRRALVHELEHVRRRDWTVHLLARAACALYWFHPLAWVAWRRLCLEAERACDDAVMRVADGPDYAEQLVLLARRLSGGAQPALAMASRGDLARRVTAVLDPGQSRARIGRLRAAAVLAAVAGAVLLVAPLRVVGAAARVDVLDVEKDEDGEGARAGLFAGRALGRALVEAAGEGRLQEVQALLDAGADVNAVVDGDGTALIVAAREGHDELVRLLLERGADVNLPARGDGNPLIMAAREGHDHVVELLLDRGASVDAVVPEDENALIQAAGHGRLAVVKLLVARGADVNARAFAEPAWERPDGEWRTPLSMARRGGHREVVRFLAASGARE